MINQMNLVKKKNCYGSNGGFPLNKVTTAKYNLFNFIPVNLFLQFSKMANLYFLILLVMECFPSITSDGRVPPVLLYPLTFVVGLSMIKDAYEDL